VSGLAKVGHWTRLGPGDDHVFERRLQMPVSFDSRLDHHVDFLRQPLAMRERVEQLLRQAADDLGIAAGKELFAAIKTSAFREL
jgi:hypothetical protein